MNLKDRLISYGMGDRPEVLRAVSDAILAIEHHDLSREDLNLTLDLLSSSGYKELTNSPVFSDEDWGQFNYGGVKPGDYVKVKKNMYDSSTGLAHNDRVGVVLNISARRVSVRYLGTRGRATMTHPIDNLLSLKHSVQWKTKQNQKED